MSKKFRNLLIAVAFGTFTQIEMARAHTLTDQEILANPCGKAHAEAIICCGTPAKCILGSPNISGDDGDGTLATMLQIAAGVGGALSMIPPSSVAGMCKKMQTVALFSAAVNTYFSVNCSTYVSTCQRACKQESQKASGGDDQACDTDDEETRKLEAYKDQMDSDRDACTAAKLKDNNPNQQSLCGDANKSKGIYTKYSEQVAQCRHKNSTWSGYVSDCGGLENQSMLMAQMAASNAIGAKMADLCKDQTTAATAATPTDMFGNPDCTNPASASTPFCQELCNRPDGKTNPNCSGFNFGTGTAGFGQGIQANSANPLLGGIPDPGVEGDQLPIIPETKATNLGIDGGTGGGSGGSGGLGSGAPMMASPDSARGGGPGQGYDTAIMRGTASGNGYSTSGGGLKTGTTGGFSGYGGGDKAITATKPFNLKDFLPGGKKNAGLLRDIASVHKDISPAHEDIFKKVTARFFQVCMRDALYDCSTLQKMKKAEEN